MALWPRCQRSSHPSIALAKPGQRTAYQGDPDLRARHQYARTHIAPPSQFTIGLSTPVSAYADPATAISPQPSQLCLAAHPRPRRLPHIAQARASPSPPSDAR